MWNRGSTRRGGCTGLLPRNSLQYVPGFGNAGQVNLGLDLVGVGTNAAGCLGRRSLGLGGSAKTCPHLHRFVFLNGTGVRLLLGDADFLENIENSFAFNFLLPGQIVYSNLVHPLFLSSALSR